ncbi:hypothetical protein GOP47_0025456 [Adiantum capillus-veneris]|uniref:Uncharacterized protein n=1 Tax=Adiantum capillus-veneris TaxID=13818 RepID=A0A9D4Z3K8_ADICA|nr:hypothetical protein GOP47_0025456 [Adiantum capillus-veneris]
MERRTQTPIAGSSKSDDSKIVTSIQLRNYQLISKSWPKPLSSFRHVSFTLKLLDLSLLYQILAPPLNLHLLQSKLIVSQLLASARVVFACTSLLSNACEDEVPLPQQVFGGHSYGANNYLICLA